MDIPRSGWMSLKQSRLCLTRTSSWSSVFWVDPWQISSNPTGATWHGKMVMTLPHIISPYIAYMMFLWCSLRKLDILRWFAVSWSWQVHWLCVSTCSPLRAPLDSLGSTRSQPPCWAVAHWGTLLGRCSVLSDTCTVSSKTAIEKMKIWLFHWPYDYCIVMKRMLTSMKMKAWQSCYAA